jgi:hypothetical protein
MSANPPPVQPLIRPRCYTHPDNAPYNDQPPQRWVLGPFAKLGQENHGNPSWRVYRGRVYKAVLWGIWFFGASICQVTAWGAPTGKQQRWTVSWGVFFYHVVSGIWNLFFIIGKTFISRHLRCPTGATLPTLDLGFWMMFLYLWQYISIQTIKILVKFIN